MSLLRRLSLSSLLVLGSGLLALQCSDPLAEDCSLTLSCGDPQHTFDTNTCRWYDQAGNLWNASPIYDHMERRWEWRDGTPTETQDFGCIPPAIGGNGGSGGSLGNDGGTGLGGTGNMPDTHCGSIGCSAGLTCDTTSGNCVNCTEESQCNGVGHCNIELHTCVPCIVDDHCTASPLAARCDNSACTACTSSAQCGDKFSGRTICVAGVCGECDDNTDCTGNVNGSLCHPETHLCVQCIGDEQCTDPTASHCGPNSTCVACTESNQCDGITSQCRTDDGRCVQCLAPSECTVSDPPTPCSRGLRTLAEAST